MSTNWEQLYNDHCMEADAEQDKLQRRINELEANLAEAEAKLSEFTTRLLSLYTFAKLAVGK